LSPTQARCVPVAVSSSTFGSDMFVSPVDTQLNDSPAVRVRNWITAIHLHRETATVIPEVRVRRARQRHSTTYSRRPFNRRLLWFARQSISYGSRLPQKGMEKGNRTCQEQRRAGGISHSDYRVEACELR